jgi:hypothetical protein
MRNKCTRDKFTRENETREKEGSERENMRDIAGMRERESRYDLGK